MYKDIIKRILFKLDKQIEQGWIILNISKNDFKLIKNELRYFKAYNTTSYKGVEINIIN